MHLFLYLLFCSIWRLWLNSDLIIETLCPYCFIVVAMQIYNITLLKSRRFNWPTFWNFTCVHLWRCYEYIWDSKSLARVEYGGATVYRNFLRRFMFYKCIRFNTQWVAKDIAYVEFNEICDLKVDSPCLYTRHQPTQNYNCTYVTLVKFLCPATDDKHKRMKEG